MALEIVDEGQAIGLPALLVAQRVELEGDAVGAEAQRLQDVGAEGDDLDVAHGLGHADQLHPDLMELAKAALLRPLVAEHRPA